MSREDVKKQTPVILQVVGIVIFAALVILDAFVKDWEMDWTLKLCFAAFALGARPETFFAIFGRGGNEKE
jgi:hypothetical protein